MATPLKRLTLTQYRKEKKQINNFQNITPVAKTLKDLQTIEPFSVNKFFKIAVKSLCIELYH